MSQGGPNNSAGSGAPPIETITGNSGGPVGPDGAFNLDLLGNNAVGIDVVGTPASNLLTIIGLDSSEVQQGTVRLATDAETTTGTSQALAVHPEGLNQRLGPQTINGLIYGQGGAGTNLASLAEATNGQLPIGSTGNPPTLATITAGTHVTITNGAGSITIDSDGPSTYIVTALDNTDSPYTALSTEEYFSCDVSAGVLTIKLPDSVTTGKYFTVKDSTGSAAGFNITVTTVTGVVTIDGGVSYVMNTNYQAAGFLFNGTSYEVI